MRRWSLFVLALVAMLGVALIGRGPGIAAQDATPAGGMEGMPAGVTFSPIAFGQAQQLMLPDAADLALFRLTIDPGAKFTDEGNDPSTGLLYVESGTVTFTLKDTVQVLRAQNMAAMIGAPGATPMAEGTSPFEEVAANTEFQLQAGDSVLIPANVGGEARNDGDQPASMLVANVGPPEGPEATPAS
jgi:quercetin dioxygenase-like cupin family protein